MSRSIASNYGLARVLPIVNNSSRWKDFFEEFFCWRRYGRVLEAQCFNIKKNIKKCT